MRCRRASKRAMLRRYPSCWRSRLRTLVDVLGRHCSLQCVHPDCEAGAGIALYCRYRLFLPDLKGCRRALPDIFSSGTAVCAMTHPTFVISRSWVRIPSLALLLKAHSEAVTRRTEHSLAAVEVNRASLGYPFSTPASFLTCISAASMRRTRALLANGCFDF
jgi:hypothetical protein